MIRPLALAALAVALGSTAVAAPAVVEPPSLAAVRVDDRAGDPLPRQLVFTEAGGDRAPLSRWLTGRRPALLVLAYVRCPMLCSVVLQTVADAAAAMALAPGVDYDLVTVSIDPRETPVDAAGKQRALLRRIGRDGDDRAWPFLRGDEAAIAALADAVGFRYRYDPRADQYAHPAVVFVITPDGRLAAAMPGVDLSPDELAAALTSAGRGEITPPIAAAVLRCFRFDPAHRRYRERIQTAFRIGAVVVFMALASLIGGLVVWERRRGR